MSDTTTKRMIAAYEQSREPTMFLAGLFRSPPQNFHTSEKVEIDIVRSDEDIAIVIQDLSTGRRWNSADLYTNKEFVPPIYKEAIPLNAFDLIKRIPGQDPFQQPDFRSNVILRMMQGMVKIERKIRRAVELQCAQVLTEGIVTLKDANGVTLYTIDYKPKATHKVTVGTSWAGAADIAADIASIANVIRNDGLADPDQLIMGETAFEYFVKNDDIQKRYDQRRLDLGTISPMRQIGQGGNYRGVVEIGNYRYDIWTYAGRYKDPQTGTVTPYIPNDYVIVRASTGRLDATWGAIPNIAQELGQQRSFPEFPTRFTMPAGGMDMSTNIWMSEDGEQLFGGVGSRPLMIPTAIDTFGRLDVVP